MKCRVPTKVDIICKQIEQEKTEACVRTQYFMFLAFNRALGIGPQRFGRVLGEYETVLKWYDEAKTDGIAEEALLNALNSIGLPMTNLYGLDKE